VILQIIKRPDCAVLMQMARAGNEPGNGSLYVAGDARCFRRVIDVMRASCGQFRAVLAAGHKPSCANASATITAMPC
jgi:hypothetical protein